MSKRYILAITLLVILGLLSSQSLLVNAQGEGIEEEDLDSFFEDSDIEVPDEEIFDEPIVDIPEEPTEERTITEETVEIPQPVYEPPEPIPVFESNTEKYIYYARKYLVELCLASIFLVYILNIYVGQKVNTKIVSMWLAEALPLLKKNFHHLGFGEESNNSISQLKYHEFEFFASGRDYCHYLFLHMITKKRQDVIGGALFGLIWPDNDRIILDIPIDSELPLEILVCKKNKVETHLQEMPHIKQFVGQVNAKSFANTGLGVLAESPEAVDIVFPRKFTNAFQAFEKHLEFLHITDQKVYTQYPLVLKVELLMGSSPAEFKQSVKLLEVLLDLVDHVAKSVKLPSRVLEKAKKAREAEEKKKTQQAQERRQKEIEEKREQREREEKEKMKKMTPAEKAKYKEKIKKQEMKKAMRGRNKVIKF